MGFAVRTRFDWKIGTRTLALGKRTLVMGVLNVTPDSFSDGGYYLNSELAVEHGLRLLDEGADILDIGGESTRPGARGDVTLTEEQERIGPVIEALLQERPGAVLSIDTYHAATARSAVEAGVEIVNDVSGFLWDTEMAATCAELECGLVLMHTRGRSEQWSSMPALGADEVVPLVRDGLRWVIGAANAAGIARNRIVLDPGFGFGKRVEENYPLLARFDSLQALGFPLLAGVSRKGFLAKTMAAVHGGTPPELMKRVHGSNAGNVAAVLGGAHMVRVHDVMAAREAVAIADAVLAAG